MTRLAALLPVAFVLWVVFPLAIARFLRGPKTEGQEAIGADICLHGVCPEECPSCRPMPPVVASSDLDPLERLYLAPAYGEER